MATTKKTPSKAASSTAVATRKSTAVSVVNVKEMLARIAAESEGKTAPGGGNKIRVTQDKQFTLPDGTKTREPLQVVIVDFTSKNEFYEGAYDKDNIASPVCFAIGDQALKLVPSGNSTDKQANSCGECPMNAFGSKGAGKACKNTRLLAVMPSDADADTPLWLLQVSPTALKGFDGYVKDVQRQFGTPPVGVVTTVSFGDSDYATLAFGGALENPNIEVHLSRYDEAKALLAEEPMLTPKAEKPAAKAPAKRPAVAGRR